LQALTTEHSNLAPLLMLYFRDDVAAWASKRAGRPLMASVKPIVSDLNLKQLSAYNVRSCAERFKLVGTLALACCLQSCISGL
jgi:hypothetical protein